MDKTQLIQMYSSMLRIRLVEEGIVERYPEQEMRCPVHLCIGQEAAEVGSCAALEPGDQVFSGHRAHGHYLAKGGDLKAMLAEIYGKETGCTGGVGGSMHLVDLQAGFMGAVPIIGATIPIGVGAAFASRYFEDGKVVMIFLGDGACETGVFHESLAIAALHKLPVVFVVENNLYSVYSSLDVRQPSGRTITDLAAGHGVAVDSGDGNDVLAVHDKAKIAVGRARRGDGPTLLEFHTYRLREHCGPDYDNDIGYRTEQEFKDWLARDPLELFKKHLGATGVLQEAEIAAMKDQLKAEIDEAFQFAKDSPFPSPDNAARHVYAGQQGDVAP